MTEPDSGLEEEIRRALCAAGDLVIPAGDGLNKIRERTAGRPHALGWILAYATHLPNRLATWVRVAGSEVAATAHGHSSLPRALRSARRWPHRAGHALRSPSAWIRPVLAATIALAIVIGTTLAIPRLRHTVGVTLLGEGTSSGPNSSAGGAGGGGQAQSHRASVVKPPPGQPLDAILPWREPSRCRTGGGTAARHQTGGTVASPGADSGPNSGSGTAAAGPAAGSPPGTMAGPPTPSVLSSACPASSGTSASASPLSTPTTTPTSTPTTTPTTTPTSTPTTTPTSTPTTTPTSTPTTTPTTTPTSTPTSTPTTTPTSSPSTTDSPDGSGSPTSPTESTDAGPSPG